jgi:hypothetical protein
VLTLAESDAELQRLSILRKNHADEQFIIRRRLKDLPGDIRRLRQRAEGLEKDTRTLAAHPGHAVTLGRHSIAGDEAVIALSDRLDRLPLTVSETRYVELGAYRGLKFGVVLHPSYHPELYLQGEATRRADIRRDARGLAVLNALNRLAGGYEEAEQSTRRDLQIAETQLADFQKRQGTAFTHDAYLKELSGLREQLRLALSTPDGEAGAIAETIKKLRESHTVEAAPQREAKAVAAETPVTARIRRRAEERASVDGDGDRETQGEGEWVRKLAEQARARAEWIREPG